MAQTAEALSFAAGAFAAFGGTIADWVIIYLLAQLAGAPYATMTANQLSINAASYTGNFGCTIAQAVMIYLLGNITTGGGSGGGVFSDNYHGVAPVFTPTSSSAIATDTVTGVRWEYLNGGWQMDGTTINPAL